MTIIPIKVWREALQIKSFRTQIILTAILLLLCAVAAPIVFRYIQGRDGLQLNDSLLTFLPAVDLSKEIFIILYLLIISAILSMLYKPQLFLRTLKAYVLLTIFRFITILALPLEPPQNMVELIDPFVQHLFYQQQPITKDLFFSGHTSLLALLVIAVPSVRLRVLLSIGTLAIGTMLLLQHAHYTIDVVFAPLFSWLVYILVKPKQLDG